MPIDAYIGSSESNEWYTPPYIVGRVRNVLGTIDLDPASSLTANAIVRAEHYYNEGDGGLRQSWFGNVFLNPPYGTLVSPFTHKLVDEYERGSVKSAILLVAARTDTQWFQYFRDYPRCFLRGRVRFIDSATGEVSGPAGFPSAVVYFGHDLSTFVTHFADLGDIYERIH